MTEERARGSGTTTIGRVVQPKTPEALGAVVSQVWCLQGICWYFVLFALSPLSNKTIELYKKSLKLKEIDEKC